MTGSTNREARFRPRKHRDPFGPRRPRIRDRLATYREIRSVRPRRQIPRTAVPSFFTLMNMFCGFVAIVQVHNGEFIAAAWLIVVAGVFDLLDGMFARLANATSLFGVELDSLSDVVSFGVAPGFLLHEFSLHELGVAGLILSALPALCGAVRLARFNVEFDGQKHDFFEGLPIPAQAMAVVAFILSCRDVDFSAWFEYGSFSIVVPMVVILSALMVTKIPFSSIPKPTLRSVRAHPRTWTGYGICLILILTLQETGLLVSLALYLTFGIGKSLVQAVQVMWSSTDADRPLSSEG